MKKEKCSSFLGRNGFRGGIVGRLLDAGLLLMLRPLVFYSLFLVFVVVFLHVYY